MVIGYDENGCVVVIDDWLWEIVLILVGILLLIVFWMLIGFLVDNDDFIDGWD